MDGTIHTIAATAPPFVCVACRGPLVERECRACGRSYPALADTIPVLTRAPGELLARARADLEATAQRLTARSRDLASGSTTRTTVLARLADAYAQNASLFARLAAAIATPPGTPSADRSSYVIDIVDYLRIAGTSDGADDETVIARALAARLSTPGGLAVVLGAGLGTHARMIAPTFDSVVAVELSPAMTLAALAAEAAPITLAEINERNAWKVDDVVHEFAATVPPLPSNVTRCVADALQLPLADGAAAAVVSVFFTDVVSLASLVAEARRVLQPGGVFVHIGPLGWHFYRPAEMWSAEEARALFADGGLPIVDEGTVTTRLLPSPRRMSNATIEAWAFTAQRRRPAS